MILAFVTVICYINVLHINNKRMKYKQRKYEYCSYSSKINTLLFKFKGVRCIIEMKHKGMNTPTKLDGCWAHYYLFLVTIRSEFKQMWCCSNIQRYKQLSKHTFSLSILLGSRGCVVISKSCIYRAYRGVLCSMVIPYLSVLFTVVQYDITLYSTKY